MRTLILKSVLFLSIFCGLMYASDLLFYHNKSGLIGMVNDFYEAKEGSVDILLVGNSHMGLGVDPYILEARTRMKTEALSGAGTDIYQIYHNISEALKTQSPKLVILETYPMIMHNSSSFGVSSDAVLKVVDNKAFDEYSAYTYRDIMIEDRGEDFYQKFYLFRYKNRLLDPKSFIDDLKYSTNESNKRDLQLMQRKNSFITKAQVEKFKEKRYPGNEIYLDKKEHFFVDKLIALSEKHDFDLLFFTVPVYDSYYKLVEHSFERFHKQLSEHISGHGSVHFFDYNRYLKGLNETYLINEGEIRKSQHLNYKGIIKTSNALSEFILENYNHQPSSLSLDRTPEYLSYNSIEAAEGSMEGAISRLIYKKSYREGRKDTVRVPSEFRFVRIEGWMKHTNAPSEQSEKVIALAKDDNFVFVTINELENRTDSILIQQKGADYRFAAYSCTINKIFFEPGAYEVLHIVSSETGKSYMQRMNNWLLIE